MKKTLSLIAAVTAIVVAAVSCGPEPVPTPTPGPDPTPGPEPEPVKTLTLTATFASSSTCPKTEWAAGDQIYVMAVRGSETTTEVLKASAAGTSAEFVSSGVLPLEADGYYAYIPGTGVAGFKDGKYWESETMFGAVPSFVIASSKTASLEFKGIYPQLSVDVVDPEAAIAQLSGNNGEILEEGILVAFADQSVSKNPSSSSSQKSLSCSMKGPGTVVFALQPGLSLEAGYMIRILDSEGKLVSRTEVKEPVVFAASQKYVAPTPEKEVIPVKSKTFDPSKVKCSFGVISDTHIDGAGTVPAQKLKTALQQIGTKARETDSDGVDAILIAGDLINSPYTTGSYTEANHFKSIYESVYDPAEVPMIYTIGNHDVYGQWSSTMVSNASNISRIFGDKYFTTDIDNDMRTKYECRHCVVGGYHVLCVSPTSKASPSAGYDPVAIAWLDNQLKAITEAEPEKYVFVLTHPMIYNTVYGSDLLYGSLAWYTSALTPTLQKYPQVMAFGGHLHFPINDPRNIWQGDFTVFGTASTRYMAIENGSYQNMAGATTMNDKDEFSEGYVFQMDESGNVRVIRMDFYRNQVIGEYQELAYPQSDLSHLRTYSHIARAAANQAPKMSKVEAVKTVTGYNATWTKAEDDEFAHHYVVTLLRNDSPFASYKVLADFYRNPEKETMKSEYTQYLGMLTAGSYKLSVVAYDSWGASSNTCSTTFTVEGGGSGESAKAEVYVDVDFTAGGVSDSKGHATLINVNAPIATKTVTHKGTSASVVAASFSGDKYISGVLKEISSAAEMQTFASQSFSVEAFYVDKAPGSAVHAVLCATEMGGWGLAVRATGVPYFIVGDVAYNKYVNADASSAASTSDLTHVVGVYNAANKQIAIYVNGVLSATSAISGPFFPGKGDTFNRFIIGGDTKDGEVYGDFKPTDMLLVDAKIYTGALTSTEVTSAYNAAVAALK